MNVVLTHQRWALYDVLASIARERQPRSYLEVGVSLGLSLEAVLDNCTPAVLCLVDSWGGESGGQNLGDHSHVEALLAKRGFPRDHVVFADGDSHEVIKKISPATALRFNLILVDGDHSEEGAAQDLRDCWPLLMPSGLMVFDDVSPEFYHPYLLKVWEEFCAEVGCVEVYRELNDKYGEHTMSHGVVVGEKK